MKDKIIHGDSLEVLKTLADESVHCCVTSPPYWGLRNYGMNGQLGLEKTPEEFIVKMVEIFHEVKRMLTKDGTCWINIGDSYAAYWGDKYGKAQSFNDTRDNIGNAPPSKPSMEFGKQGGIKPKDLVGIPWMLAFALRADGWYLRQDIIWSKPNPMPESVTDRCTKSHEYIFLLSKSAKYYYDAEAIKTDMKQEMTKGVPGRKVVGAGSHSAVDHATEEGRKRKEENTKGYQHRGEGDKKLTGHSGNKDKDGNLIGNGKANRRSVWSITTQPYSEAHFATFPEELPELCIKAGCPIDGIVLDPFSGAGTTAMVAKKLNRNYIGIELNEEYIKISTKRLASELGMFQ